jgi:NDP-sugar pyrophosphorylase family protein
MKAFILAGGLGTRLRPITNRIQKVMVEIGGKPMLEHLVHLCSRHRITDIVIGVHYRSDSIQAYFGDGKKFNVNIRYSYEPHKMGDAGAMKHASALLGEDPFVVLNGDVMTNVDLTAMGAFHEAKGGLGTFLVHSTDHPYDSDIVRYDEDLLITDFFRPNPGDEFKPISKSGTHIFQPDVLTFIPQGVNYSLGGELVFDLLSKHQRLYAYYSDCYSRDMGTPERLARVEKDYQNGAF